MAFDSNLVNFLTVGDFATDSSYELPLSQQLVTSAEYGLTFANSGSGSTYELQTSGNMRALMTLQQTESYGVVISVPQVDGGIITRSLTGSGSISISNASGAAGNPTLSVTPSSTVQLINTRIGGSVIGSARSTLNFIQGTNIGLNAVDTGTVTDITINATQDPLIASGPFVITEESSDLTGATNLGALATGYLFSTVSAGAATLSTVASIPAASIAGTAVTLSGAQTITGVKTFTPKQIFTNSVQIPLNATNGYVLTSDASGNATWAANGNGDVTLAGAQTFTGVKTFTPQQIFTNSIQIPLGAADGYVLTSDASGNMTLQAAGTGNLTATVSTTDATPTTLATAAIASNTALTISGILVARNTSGTINNACGGRFTVTAINTAGTVALAATQDVTVQSTSTATFNVVVSGTNLIIQVTGIAATNYSWKTSFTATTL